jgi:hypothetical protein
MHAHALVISIIAKAADIHVVRLAASADRFSTVSFEWTAFPVAACTRSLSGSTARLCQPEAVHRQLGDAKPLINVLRERPPRIVDALEIGALVGELIEGLKRRLGTTLPREKPAEDCADGTAGALIKMNSLEIGQRSRRAAALPNSFSALCYVIHRRGAKGLLGSIFAGAGSCVIKKGKFHADFHVHRFHPSLHSAP